MQWITGVPHHVIRSRGHQLRDYHQGEAGRRPPLRGPRAVARAGLGAWLPARAEPAVTASRGGTSPPCRRAVAPGTHSLCAGEGARRGAGIRAAVGREWADGPLDNTELGGGDRDGLVCEPSKLGAALERRRGEAGPAWGSRGRGPREEL